MRILITGSEGSLMQAVIPKLLAHGHTIVGVDNLYRYGKKSEFAGKDYEFICCDLTNRTETFELFDNKFDAVFLAAAKIYGVAGFNHYCADIISDDTAIQGNILQACAKFSIGKVVYISSSMVYETCIQDTTYPVTEDMVNECSLPKTDYGLSKLLGERMCQSFYKQYNINYTIWRPFNIITPKETAMDQQGFSHVFADYIKNLLDYKLNPLPIIGDGNQIRCFTWIDDVSTIIADYSFIDHTKNQAFNICNVEPITMKMLAEKIYQYANNNNPLTFVTVNEYPNDVKIRIPSVAKLFDAIGNYNFKSINDCIKYCV